MSEDTEKIKDKIRKLLNLANNPAAFEGEITNALRFANRLMLERNITPDQLGEPQDPHERAASMEYGAGDAFTYGQKSTFWETVLINAVCNLVGSVGSYRVAGLQSVTDEHGLIQFNTQGHPELGTKMVFYGPLEDVRDAVDLFKEWSRIIVAMARMKFGGTVSLKGKSYCEGFVESLFKGVTKVQAEQTEAHASTGTSLVVVKAAELMVIKKDLGKKWVEKNRGVKLRQSERSVNKQDAEAYGAGLSDGKKVDFKHKRALKLEG